MRQALVDVHHSLTTSENKGAEVPNILVLHKNEVLEYNFVVMTKVRAVTPLVSLTVADDLLKHFHAPYFSQHVFTRHVQTVKGFSGSHDVIQI